MGEEWGFSAVERNFREAVVSKIASGFRGVRLASHCTTTEVSDYNKKRRLGGEFLLRRKPPAPQQNCSRNFAFTVDKRGSGGLSYAYKHGEPSGEP